MIWDTLKVATLVLKPALVALRYCDGMKGGTVALLYDLLLELDKYYSKPIKGLDEALRKKMHNVFMSRWSAFHAPLHSAACAMDKQLSQAEFEECWSESIIKCGLSPSVVDDPLFRKALVTTDRMWQSAVCMGKGS